MNGFDLVLSPGIKTDPKEGSRIVFEDEPGNLLPPFFLASPEIEVQIPDIVGNIVFLYPLITELL